MYGLPESPKGSVIFEDKKLLVCAALYPITKGHTVIVWRKRKKDLHDLNDGEYDYLMDVVDVARDTLLKVLGVEKVYLLYMDETKQVHWHLVPRYNKKGVNVFRHVPLKAKTFPLVGRLKKVFTDKYKSRIIVK